MLKKMIIRYFIICTLTLALTSANGLEDKALVDGQYVSLDAAPLRPDGWGVYTWGASHMVNAQTAPNVVGLTDVLHWRQVEPAKGDYRFDESLGNTLRRARENDFYVVTLLWVTSPGGSTPEWVFEEGGVPAVTTHRERSPLGELEQPHRYPYYLDANYRKHYSDVIEAFGRYVDSLPDDLFDRLLFVQVCEGSTGDGQPYKGAPVDGFEQYQISKKVWSDFRLEAWEMYKRAFIDGKDRQVAIIVNGDANEEREFEWLMSNLDYIGVKQGMFSHGWHISNAVERRNQWQEEQKAAEIAGKRTFVRGEEDGEMFVYGRMTKNTPRGLYNSAAFALYNGLDLWNIPSSALIVPENQYGFEFFNKYAGHRNPRTAPAAFCALREGLDASDIKKFPVSEFGQASKDNIPRYLKIAEAYSEYGAIQGDPEKAIGGGMINRKRMDYNDVGWSIHPGNYWRFLEQIDPEETSIGWWHQGPEESLYAQFSRSFNIEDGKGAMYFKLDPFFFNRSAEPQDVGLKIVYLDRGRGSWSLIYNQNGENKKLTSKNQDTNEWKVVEFTLPSAIFQGSLAKGADLILNYEGGDTTLFEIIELDRL